ncbi:MAG: proton-conducting transporter membrane subunit [Acidimicrobiales bacterium]
MTTAVALLLTGLCILALGALVDLVLGAGRRVARPMPYLLGMLASACLTATGVLSTLSPGRTLDLGNVLGVGTTSIHLDGLAGLFLTLTSGLGVLVSASMASFVRPPGRVQGHGLGAGYLLLLGSVAIVIVAGDAFSFLFAWEALTASFYVLAAYSRTKPGQTTASWATLGAGKAGGAALLLGFLLLAASAHNFTLAAWHGLPSGPTEQAAYCLIVAGFAAKVGLVPFHVWMPIGYPAAGGPTRAAMAGLAVNAGFYGLWRFLGVLSPPPLWLAAAVLVIGGVTALLGIVFAVVQADLNRVIAYSSVENAGVIMVCYGLALSGRVTHQAGLVAIGMLAATLQVVAHGVAKSSLFTAGANVEADYRTSLLERLSGVGRSHPFSSATFGLAALTLAGLPPTIGFVSEWFVLESLMQQFRVHSLALRLSMAAAGALVALTAGVAALTFARLVGLFLLGRRSQPSVRVSGGERSLLGRSALVLLGATCLGFAAFAPYVIRYIALGLGAVVPRQVTEQALKSPWVLQPVFSGFSILSPSWAFVAMAVGLPAVLGGALLLSKGRYLKIRRVPSWHSGTGGVAGPDSYSAFGYANVARNVLGNILGARRSVLVLGDRDPFALADSATGDSPAGSARAEEDAQVHVRHKTEVVEPWEAYVYRPARRLVLLVSRLLKGLQSGHLEAYMAYMLVALLAVLAVAAALG